LNSAKAATSLAFKILVILNNLKEVNRQIQALAIVFTRSISPTATRPW
jgi:hypothetical protein